MAAGQRGAVLVVSLLLLLVLTVIGVASMRSTTMEETMAGNSKNRNLALQAAEAALRAGEQGAENSDDGDYGTVVGYYAQSTDLDPFALSWSSLDSADGPALSDDSNSGIAAAANPRYVVQQMGSISAQGATSGRSLVKMQYGGETKLHVYRVTARGKGGTDSAVVYLESTYAVRE